jgi:BlaI family penicillinase repressor
MPSRPDTQLSRRERQIMDLVYARGQASVAEVHQMMPDRPSYSAVRALMRILEEKGHLKHKAQGNKYIYLPIRSREQASKSAMQRLLRTFFDGSAERAVAAILEASDTRPTQDELDRLEQLIQRTKKEGR